MSFFGNRRQAEASPSPRRPNHRWSLRPSVSRRSWVLTAPWKAICAAAPMCAWMAPSAERWRSAGTCWSGKPPRSTPILTPRISPSPGRYTATSPARKFNYCAPGASGAIYAATALTTEEGAFIDGKINMISTQTEEISAPPEDSAAGVGVVEDETISEPAATEDQLVENISAGEESELPVGGDWTEGQTTADYKDLPDDETRQST